MLWLKTAHVRSIAALDSSQRGVIVGNNLRMLYWPAAPFLELINQLHMLHTEEGWSQ